MDVGGEGDYIYYTYRNTVTTRMTSALRWAAMGAILMFHNCEGQSRKTVSTDHNLWSERKVKADSNRSPSAYQPTALPLGQTGSCMTNNNNGFFLKPNYAGQSAEEYKHNRTNMYIQMKAVISLIYN